MSLNTDRNCENLKREVETLRYEADQRREQEEADHYRQEERRRQQKREHEESLCYADNWPDAFNKGMIRLAKEADLENRLFSTLSAADRERYGTPYFQGYLEEVRRTQQIYYEELKNSEPVIAELEFQIEQERLRALARVADRLQAEFPNSEGPQAFRDNNPDYLVNW
jgi:hypothetical protein